MCPGKNVFLCGRPSAEKCVLGSGGVRSGVKAVCDADDFTVIAVVCQALPNAATPNIYQRINSSAARGGEVFAKEGDTRVLNSVA